MFATAFHTSRYYILFTAMACLCVLLGGPSYAAGADSLFIAGATYYEPGASGPGWVWTDADHLELNGYAGEAIGADGDLVVTLVGQSSVVETHTPDADISMSGMEVWGNLRLIGSGSLTATGSQCGIHVPQALVVDGCTVDARADGANADSQTVAGILACGLTVRGGGRVVVSGAGAATGLDCYGVRLLDEGAGLGADGGTLVVDASWLDASGTDAGVACDRGSLVTARLVTPAGGAFGDVGVVDVDGAVAAHVAIEPEGAIDPAGESGARDVTGDGGATAGEPATRPGAEATDVPAGATTKTTTVATTVTTTSAKTTVTKPSRPNASTTTTTKLPKTADSPWIAPSSALFLLGIAPACAVLGSASVCV